jgi:hypothetical protein
MAAAEAATPTNDASMTVVRNELILSAMATPPGPTVAKYERAEKAKVQSDGAKRTAGAKESDKRDPALDICATRVLTMSTQKEPPTREAATGPPTALPMRKMLTGSTSLPLFAFVVRMVASTSEREEERRKSHEATRPTTDGRKPAGAVARGNAKNPPPIVVPAMSRLDESTVPSPSSFSCFALRLVEITVLDRRTVPACELVLKAHALAR